MQLGALHLIASEVTFPATHGLTPPQWHEASSAVVQRVRNSRAPELQPSDLT
jgi:hypothetical protein